MAIDRTLSASTRICSVEGCESLHIIARGWCNTHYHRWWRYGSTDERPQRPEVCAVEGCDRPHRAKGMCTTHWQRWRKHGSPDVVLPKGSSTASGEGNPSWAGDGVTYNGAHQRLSRSRGSAKTHDCIDCGDQAADWSLSKAAPATILDAKTGMRYSTDPASYVPRCRPCHKRYDRVGI